MPDPELIFRVTGDLSPVVKGLDDLEKNIKSKKRSFTGSGIVRSTIKAATIPLIALTGAIAFSVKAFQETELSQNKLRQVLAATGHAAGITAKEAFKLSSDLENVTTFSDEAINEVQSLLFTFKGISKESFPRATKVVLDLSIIMQTDTKSAAIQLGKVLQQPIELLSSLSKAGVSFTDEQSKQIKELVEIGKLNQAQSLILSEIETQSGNQSEAAAKGTGIFIQLANRIQNIASALGEVFAPGLIEDAKEMLEVVRTVNKNKEQILVIKATFAATGKQILILINGVLDAFLFRFAGLLNISKGVIDFITGKGFLRGQVGLDQIKESFNFFDVIGEFKKAGEETFENVLERQNQYDRMAREQVMRIDQVEIQSASSEVEAALTDKELRTKLEKDKGKNLAELVEQNRIDLIEEREFLNEEFDIFKAEFESENLTQQKEFNRLLRDKMVTDAELRKQIKLEGSAEQQNIMNSMRFATLEQNGVLGEAINFAFIDNETKITKLAFDKSLSLKKITEITELVKLDIVEDLIETVQIGLKTFQAQNTAAYKATEIVADGIEVFQALNVLGFLFVQAVVSFKWALAAAIAIAALIVVTAYAINIKKIIAVEPRPRFAVGASGKLPFAQPGRHPILRDVRVPGISIPSRKSRNLIMNVSYPGDLDGLIRIEGGGTNAV